MRDPYGDVRTSPTGVFVRNSDSDTAASYRYFQNLQNLSEEDLARSRRARVRPEEEDDHNSQSTANSRVGGVDSRRETILKRRIESEQRKLEELRDAWSRLKEILPVTHQKSSRVSLLDRATNHVRHLELTKAALEERLKSAESEFKHLLHINEILSARASRSSTGLPQSHPDMEVE
ncbi:hypothetical protein K438DRAFT_1607247 [Mycena galopus ATCC 62051]|nr:hypothetical protein K438DRAFT_1607247 [Mycena galopus ATCC 62051]